MARNLLYHLNRLQDVLSLPRTTSGNYPVNDDPLHGDDILTEDVWEASKIVTGDLARRGLMDVISTSTPITKSQNAYSLPDNVCRLHSVEYYDGTSWRGPLVSIHYDDYVRISASQTEGTPQYYTHTLSDSREALLTVSGGITQSSFRDAGPISLVSDTLLTSTSTGNQINRDDLIFNITQDSSGVVDYLDMGSTRWTSGNNQETTAVSWNVTSSEVDNIPANSVVITDTRVTGTDGVPQFSASVAAKAGDILLQPHNKTWLVIQEVYHSSSNPDGMVITFDVIRGAASTFDPNILAPLGGPLQIGPPDKMVVKSDDPFVLDANQGFLGGVTNIVKTYVTEDSDPSSDITADYTVTFGTEGMTIQNDPGGIDLSAYANNGHMLIFTTSGLGNLSAETYSTYIGDVAIISSTVNQLLLYTTGEIDSATGGILNSSHVVHPLTYIDTGDILTVSVAKPPLMVGDIIQVESQFATLDTIQVFPYPDISDVTGSEGFRMTYVPYPSKPTKSDQVIELADAFNDAILSKAHEYATRREINRVEPYEDSIRRATSIARPLPSSGLMRDRRGGISRGINFVVPS